MGVWDQARFGAGLFLQDVGNVLGLPEMGISERVAGRSTPSSIGVARANDLPSYSTPSYPSSQNPISWAGTSTGGSTGGSYQAPQQQDQTQQQQSSQPSGPSALDSGYNEYFRMLDDQMNSLGGQVGNQQQIAQNTYDQGLNTVTSQFNQGQSQLEGNRKKTLNDLSENLMQSFRQGNTYLGTRGASDSSAANQYSYALAKEGNRSRGDVQAQYDQNLFQLKNTYDTETKNLELQKNTQLQQIAQWFSEAQNTLRTQKGQAAIQKSQDALSYAMQMAQQVQQQTATKIAALDTWAANHATSFQQLAGQLASTSQFSTQAPEIAGLMGGNSGYQGAFTGYGSTEEKNKGLFGY